MTNKKDKLRADLEALSEKCKRLETSAEATEADECEVLSELNGLMRRFLDERTPKADSHNRPEIESHD